MVPGALSLAAATLLIIGIGGAGSVSPAPLPTAPAEVKIVARSPAGEVVNARTAAVAVGAIVSSLRTDREVTAANARHPAGSATVIDVRLRTGDAEDADQAIARIRATVDPGPLELTYTAPALALTEARDSFRGQIGKLELLAAPIAALCLFAALGLGAGLVSILATALALGAALVATRVTHGYLFAVAPAAAIGTAQAIELSGLHLALLRQEAPGGRPTRGIPERVLRRWLPAAAAATAVRAIGPLALLATSFEGAGSIALATAVASIVAFAAVLLAAPSITGLLAWGADRQESRLARAAHGAPGALARSRLRLAAALAAAVVLCLVLGFPAHEATTSPLVSAPAPAPGGVLAGIGLAALIFGLGVAALLAVGQPLATRVRLALASPYSLLAVPPAIGALVYAVQEAHLAGLAGERASLVGGALATCVVAVACIAAGRTVLTVFSAREERSAGVGSTGAAELSAALTLPGFAASTGVLAGVFGVLCAADLDAAREAGLGVAVGVLVDLVVLRVPLLGFLARWGE